MTLYAVSADDLTNHFADAFVREYVEHDYDVSGGSRTTDAGGA